MGKNIISKLHSIVFTETRNRLEWSASLFCFVLHPTRCMQAVSVCRLSRLDCFRFHGFWACNGFWLWLYSLKCSLWGKTLVLFLLVSPQFQKFQLFLKVHMAARVECTIRVSREMENCVHKLTTLSEKAWNENFSILISECSENNWIRKSSGEHFLSMNHLHSRSNQLFSSHTYAL